ncbi:M20 family metallopeptidase [Roseomonas sp. NAR14]|uniref:M20 family metallopeptidase n=1 Tax=Roseomonas acroporae TaxID=2937791 RepID=A0A9X1YAC1_9PROT|nr:M20 family metallopeptidase [Roseomonas acroporae]MCK8786453.1 M20 family metallopeptidase [Roseomonas acroporae]
MPQTAIGPSAAASGPMLDELRDWVLLETPTTDAAAVNRLLDLAESGLGAAGAHLRRLPGTRGHGDMLLARSPGEGKAVLVVGHLDTVWDHGTLARMPYRVEGPRAHGPGIYDMKAGSYIAFHALRAILREGTPTRRPVALLLTPDEEVGSPSSRATIEAAARDAVAVLIPEPASAEGHCVTARKGVGRFAVRVAGRAAHSGTHWEAGRSAVLGLARVIEAANGLVDLARGVTTNVAPVWGGTRPNVVAHEAGCEIDLRVATAEDGERLERALLALPETLAPGLPDGIAIEVTGGMNRPPFAETPAGLALYERARAIAAGNGYELPRQYRGGGSDGNFTAALGVPTLDGLGVPGAGAHAAHEHILWEQLAPRCATLRGLMETLG